MTKASTQAPDKNPDPPPQDDAVPAPPYRNPNGGYDGNAELGTDYSETREEHTVNIGGLEHTLLLEPDDVGRYEAAS